MSVFNRTDGKPNEIPPTTVPQPGTTTYIAPPEVKKPQAVVQPMTSSAPSTPGGASIVSRALKITGQLESTEDIRIDGEVNGDVRAVSVIVGNSAKVKGNVYGETVELAGTVEGKIEAKRIVFSSTARMTGDVVHQDVKIESGAFIDGHLKPDFGKDSKSKTTNGSGHA